MALYTLFRTDPSLHAAHMQEHLDGNLCRCTGYHNIVRAVQHAAGAGSTTSSASGAGAEQGVTA